MELYRDYFTRETLTDSLVKSPYIPGQLSGLFTTRSLATTTLAIESVPQGLDAMTALPRGSSLPAVTLDKRQVFTFPIQTYGSQGSVYADEVLNARAAGTNGAAEILATRRDEVVARLRRDVDNLHERLRISCVTSPNNDFGSQPSEATIAFGTDTTKTKSELLKKIIQPIEYELAGLGFSGITVYASSGWWEALIENKSIKDTYLYSQQAAALRNDGRDAFMWGGVNFERYRASSAIKIPDNKAIAVPSGVQSLFIQAFGPDDTFDSVGAGAMGSPYYLRAFDLDDAKGWRIRIQTHCKMICTRPQVLLPLGLA
ncbi:Elements of external origin [Gammaproteobacteria bacterium]